jgi:hypothetical protein
MYASHVYNHRELVARTRRFPHDLVLVAAVAIVGLLACALAAIYAPDLAAMLPAPFAG